MVQDISPKRVIYPANVPSLRIAWTYTTGDAIESSPVIAGGVVYTGSRDHRIYAIEARTGKLLWSYTTGGAIYSTPAFADGCAIVELPDRQCDRVFSHCRQRDRLRWLD